MGSTRFPKKVMATVCGTPLIGLLLKRLALAKYVDHIVLATSVDSCNGPLVDYVDSLSVDVFQGHEDDVLDRYYQAARQYHPEAIVRITGDCPVIDPSVVDEMIEHYMQKDVDYVTDSFPQTYPDGLGTEVFSFRALELAWQESTDPFCREHVTPYFRLSDQFTKSACPNDVDHSDKRWTVDEPEDFKVVKRIFEHFHPQLDFSWTDVVDLYPKHPDWFSANAHLLRNEGSHLGTGQKLWRRAKRIIPGGNMLLSKRAEIFLPEKWPAYFNRAAGCNVWDLEGKEFLDMSIMGIGTNILGYGHPKIDEAVQRSIETGNMSTFNCPEEVLLAERILELHPWADMVCLARTDGEANALAVRIALAATGRDKIAICGYNDGLYDWYLPANMNGDLKPDNQILPGLEYKGVLQKLGVSILPFHYNDIARLENFESEHEIGVIKIDVSLCESPQDHFLEKVCKLAKEKSIVLIFDECTSGFRQTFGGLHKQYDVEPDIAVFGKALGNGYAISGVVGRREIMESAKSNFIGSTFWTGRIGPAAALATMDVMENIKSWETITHVGNKIKGHWENLAQSHSLPLEIFGLPAVPSFQFPLPDALKYKTLITQEMLKKGILAATSVYVCTEHTTATIDRYFEVLDPIFKMISECESGQSVDDLLETAVCHN